MPPLDPPGVAREQDLPPDGVPAALKQADRVKLVPGRLRISGDGIFYTLQGEGITQGMPAVFLRLHVCNLRCGWCDAWYTWSPRSIAFWTESTLCDPLELAQRVRNAVPESLRDRVNRLVVTGGEPLLQAEALDLLLDALPGWTVEIETNGTRMPTPHQLARCQFNCSPKLAHSRNSVAARIAPDVLRALNAAHTQFKFVIRDEADVDELLRDFVPLIDRDKVVLMPEGVEAAMLQDTARTIAGRALREGLRMMGRLHIDLWGAQRGR